MLFFSNYDKKHTAWSETCCVFLFYIRQRNRKKNLKGKGRKNLFRYSAFLFRILSFPDDENIPHCRIKAYKISYIFTKFRDNFKKCRVRQFFPPKELPDTAFYVH